MSQDVRPLTYSVKIEAGEFVDSGLLIKISVQIQANFCYNSFIMENQQNQQVSVSHAYVEENDFIHRVYTWMAVGLAITAFVAYYVSSSQYLVNAILGNMIVFYGLLIAELLTVLGLSVLVKKVSSQIAAFLFVLYAVLNGLTISVIFLIYTISSIGSVFIVAAGMFAIAAVYGFVTKKDLTSVGQLAMMGLFGIILASVVNLFIMNDKTSLIISYITVVIFVALTAYDIQKIKRLNAVVEIGSDTEKKAAIIGALTLYLDFINLFLNILRIMGRRK